MKIDENRRISNFKGLVTLTLTLTLDRVIRHTVMFHLLNSTYIYQIFSGQTDVRTDGRTYGRTSETHIIRSTLQSRPENVNIRWGIEYLQVCYIKYLQLYYLHLQCKYYRVLSC